MPIDATARTGLEFLDGMMAGDLPPPPMIALLDIAMVSADPGHVVMRMPASAHLYNPIGSVHGGALATLLDSVMACAIHSLLPVGRGYTTLEFKVNFLRAVTTASEMVTAVGTVVHAGRRQAVAEAKLHDAAGRLCAIASTTCLLFDLPRA